MPPSMVPSTLTSPSAQVGASKSSSPPQPVAAAEDSARPRASTGAAARAGMPTPYQVARRWSGREHQPAGQLARLEHRVGSGGLAERHARQLGDPQRAAREGARDS